MGEEITPSLWDAIRSNDVLRAQVPEWVNKILNIPFDGLEGLPTGYRGVRTRYPSVRRVTLSESYLEFLRGQVERGAGTAEWKEMMCLRLAALQDYFGTELLKLELLHEGRHFWAYLLEPSLRLVHWEEIGFTWD